MKNSLFLIPVSIVIAAFILLLTNPSVSEASEQEQASSDLAGRQQSIEERLPTTMVRQKLQSAYSLYAEGNITAAKKELDEANQLLIKAPEENSITKIENQKLANEIQALIEQLTSDSEEQQNAIVRLWHRSTALVTREMEDLIHRYNTLSTVERTLKPLLDAKMHLFYAEHDLFSNHNAKLAEYELSNVLDYLDDAVQVATPENRERIIKISKSIQALQKMTPFGSEAWNIESVNKAINDAQSDLDKAKKFATPSDAASIDKIKSELLVLQKEIVKNSAKQYYDSAMYQLVQLINDL